MLVKSSVAGLFLVIIASVHGYPADDPKTKSSTNPGIDSDKIGAQEFIGKLVTLPSANADFTIEVISQQVVLKNPNQPVNPGTNAAIKNVLHDVQHLQQLQQQLSKASNPKDAARINGQLNQALVKAQNHYNQALQQSINPANNPFKLVTNKNKVEFHTGDELKVRLLTLPVEYDDKGKVVKRTDEELKALRGKDTKLPGYESKIEDLKVGMLVKVSLVKAPVPAKTSSEEKPAKDASDPPAHKTIVKLLLVVDPTTGDTTLSGSRPGK